MTSDAAVIARSLTGDAGAQIAPLPGGGNGRSFRVQTSSGVMRFLKLYPDNPGDPRDRLGTEESALKFLDVAGFTNVPQFLAADRTSHAALLSWIDGAAITDVGPGEIVQALEFMTSLHARRTHASASAIGPASEACPSPAEAIRQIETRIQRLGPRVSEPLSELLKTRLGPLAGRLTAQARSARAATEFDSRLPDALLTLSPSDFGLHNALRRPDGGIAWIDFEYFGWDDPVKLVADFLLHPGMSLTSEYGRAFRDGAATIYAGDGDFLTRLRYMTPIYDLRWCMIVLNAFDPAHHALRLGDAERARRLAMVMARLDRIEAGYEAYGFLQ